MFSKHSLNRTVQKLWHIFTSLNFPHISSLYLFNFFLLQLEKKWDYEDYYICYYIVCQTTLDRKKRKLSWSYDLLIIRVEKQAFTSTPFEKGKENEKKMTQHTAFQQKHLPRRNSRNARRWGKYWTIFYQETRYKRHLR